jgi:hypothetical protein
VQMPTLIHTATGGKKIARIPRKMSEPHMVAFEECKGYYLMNCLTVQQLRMNEEFVKVSTLSSKLPQRTSFTDMRLR